MLGWGILDYGTRLPRPARYAIALALSLLATVARGALNPWMPPGFPFLTFFPAVVVTAVLAGTGPGLTAAILCGLAAWYYFIPPFNSFGVNLGVSLAMELYLFVVLVDVWIINRMRRATERLSAEIDRSTALAAERTTMFAELQHRVANNLGFVSSLLQLNRRAVREDPAAAERVFEQAIQRIELMGRVHRRLYAPEAAEQDVGDYLRSLSAELIGSVDARHIRVEMDVDPIRLDVARLSTLSLIVTELMTNSLKHAFAGRSAGLIQIGLKRSGGRLALSISDDGPGMPSTTPTPDGLGQRIIQGLSRQLRGELSLPGPGQSRTLVSFPA